MNNNQVRLISTGIVKGSSGAKPEPQFCTCRSKDLRQQYVNLCILSVAGGRYHENIMPCLSVCLRSGWSVMGLVVWENTRAGDYTGERGELLVKR